MIHRRLALSLVLLAAGAAHGQSPRFGLQGTLSVPSADLKTVTSSGGYGVALTLDILLSGGHVLRPRFDYIYYREKTTVDAFSFGSITYRTTDKYSINSAGLGLDYAYYTAGRPEGFYLLAGIHESRYEVKDTFSQSITGQPTITDQNRDKTKNKLGYAVGLGYDFNRAWGAQLRLTSVDLADGSDKTSFNAYNFGVTYKF
jgi:opacity protein-like surface antigen